MTIKKSRPVAEGQIKKAPEVDPELRFSFKFFDDGDGELCPDVFREGYTQALMKRLRDLSSWTIRRFTGPQDRSVRNHQHDWTTTSRRHGFAHLNYHFRAMPGWQFCLSANERGRVHGIIIDNTFYVIWLDQDHRLYP